MSGHVRSVATVPFMHTRRGEMPGPVSDPRPGTPGTAHLGRKPLGQGDRAAAAGTSGHRHARPPIMCQQYWGPRGKDRLADAHHNPDHRRGHHLPRPMAAAQVREVARSHPGRGSPAQGQPRHACACCAHLVGGCQRATERLTGWDRLAAPGSCAGASPGGRSFIHRVRINLVTAS